MRKRDWAIRALRILLVVLVCGALFKWDFIDLHALGSQLASPRFALLIACQAALIFVNIARWVRLVRAAEPELVSSLVWRAALRAHFATLVLPSLGGSDVMRLTNLPAAHRSALAGTLVADRAFALIGLAVALSASMLWVFASGQAATLAPVLRMGALVVVGVVLAPVGLEIARRISKLSNHRLVLLGQRVLNGADGALRGAQTRWPALGLSVLSMSINGATLGLAMGARSQEVAAALVVTPLLTLASAVPVTPQGVGVTEAAAEYLFGAVGLGGGAAALLLVRLAWIAATLLTGLAWLTEKAAAQGPQAKGE